MFVLFHVDDAVLEAKSVHLRRGCTAGEEDESGISGPGSAAEEGRGWEGRKGEDRRCMGGNRCAIGVPKAAHAQSRGDEELEGAIRVRP